jgi:tRNA A37 threonylcarbamoyladenosine synthetase subunit TsaC/SUA5/YrdC
VGGGDLDQARTALADGCVIAVLGGDVHHLAARRDRPDALTLLRALERGPAPSVFEVVVGSRAQARALASVWPKGAECLTERMWPGPLTVIVAIEAADALVPGDRELHISMPKERLLRTLCRDAPLAVCALRHADGSPMVDPDEVAARFTSRQIGLIVSGGTCAGPGPTIVDCTTSPPTVRHVGALPETFVDAALMMGNRRRHWFTRRSDPLR